MDQRKLEFAFHLATMQCDRNPAIVASARWPPARRAGQPRLHLEVVWELERVVGLQVGMEAAGGASKAQFKRAVAAAVHGRDMQAMRRRALPTVLQHLTVLGDPGQHPNQLQRYLALTLRPLANYYYYILLLLLLQGHHSRLGC